jgi:hypothetical protein
MALSVCSTALCRAVVALQRLEALGDAPWASMSAAHAPS